MQKTFFSLKSALFIAGLALVAISFNACKKHTDIDAQDLQNGQQLRNGASVAGLMEYYTFFTTQTQGNFEIRDYGTPISTRGTELFGYYRDGARAGEVKIGNVLLNKDSRDFTYSNSVLPIENFYGKTNIFSLGLPNGATITDSLYAPKSINVVMGTAIPNNLDIKMVGTGENIQWNADNKNTKGVIIIVSYEPSVFGNESFKNAGYTKPIANVVSIDDKGSYNMEAKLFNKIPSGCTVKILVGRTNFKFMTDSNNQNYTIHAYSTLVEFFKVR